MTFNLRSELLVFLVFLLFLLFLVIGDATAVCTSIRVFRLLGFLGFLLRALVLKISRAPVSPVDSLLFENAALYSVSVGPGSIR